MTKEYFIIKWTAPQFEGSTYKEFVRDVDAMLKTEQAKISSNLPVMLSLPSDEEINKLKNASHRAGALWLKQEIIKRGNGA